MPSSSSEDDDDIPATTETSFKGSDCEPQEEEELKEEKEPEDVELEEIEEEEEEQDEGEWDTGEEEEKSYDDDDRNYSCREIESDGNEEDLKLENSKGNAPEDNGQCHSFDSLNVLPATQGVGAQAEKEDPIKACGNVLKHDKKDPGGNQSHVNKTVSVDNTKSSSCNEKHVAADTLVRNDSGDKIGSEEQTRKSQEGIKLRAPSLITPQTRPRSVSPGAEFEDRNKRPAILCNFFAKGWCIKGNSCRFLHQKDGLVNRTDLANGADETVGSSKGELSADAGLRQHKDKSKYSSPEPPASSIVAFPFSSSHISDKILLGEREESRRWHTSSSEEHRQFPLERDGPSLSSSLKYTGNESLRQNLFLDKYHKNASQIIQGDPQIFIGPINGCPANPSSSAIQWNSFCGEEYNQPSDVPLLHKNSDHMDNKIPGSRELVRGYSLAQNNSLPEYRLFSSGSVVSSIYGNHTSSASDKTFVEPGSQNLKSHPTFYDGRASPGSNSSLSSSFKSSLPPKGSSPLRRQFACPGTSPSQGSSPLRYQKPYGSDTGYYASGSTSLPRRSSSPFYSKPEPDNLSLHGGPLDPVFSVGHKLHAIAYNWEPSVPFRPSFHLLPNFLSSPCSQYDPLLDSIELPDTGDRSLQSSSLSQRTIIQNTSRINGDSVCHDQLSQSGTSDKSMRNHGVATDTAAAAAAATGVCMDGKQNKSSMPEEEKPLGPGSAGDSSNANEVSMDHNLGQMDEIKHKKEPKTLKLFRSALVDFVKELVKPSWRGGQLSKDAHNMVVKKAVEKVFSTIQPHQIPSTPQSTNQYLSSSRPKLTKLVEAYVGKYGKS